VEVREFVFVHQTFFGAVGFRNNFKAVLAQATLFYPSIAGSFRGTIIATMLSYLHRVVYTLVITANMIDGLIAESEMAMKGDSDQPQLFASPAEMLMLDGRDFHCNSWHLEPTIRCGWLNIDFLYSF